MPDAPVPDRPTSDLAPGLTSEQRALAALLGRLLAAEWRDLQPAPAPRPEAA